MAVWSNEQPDPELAQELYRAVVENTGDLFTVVDLEGRISWVSPSWQVLGYSSEDLLGTPLWNLTHAEDVERSKSAMAKVTQEGRATASTFRVRRKDGGWALLESVLTLIRQERGEPEVVLATCRVETDRHRLLRARETLLAREHQARRVAEAARERFAFLAKASDVLGASLDYETTLKELAGLIVPRLADWYAADLVDDPLSIRNVAVAHVDPLKVDLARELQRRYPPEPARGIRRPECRADGPRGALPGDPGGAARGIGKGRASP